MNYIIKQVLALSTTCIMIFSGTPLADVVPATASGEVDFLPDVAVYDETVKDEIDNSNVFDANEVNDYTIQSAIVQAAASVGEKAPGSAKASVGEKAPGSAKASAGEKVPGEGLGPVDGGNKADSSKGAKDAKGAKGADGSATLMFTGDLMCQPPQQEAGFDGTSYNFNGTFKYVKRIFDEADLVIGNLETMVSSSLPLSRDITRLQGKPYLNSPPEFLDALKYAGFDGFILANNHNCDGGSLAIKETLNELDRREFLHTGLFGSKDDERYIITDVKGIKVGIISYARYFNDKENYLTEEEQSYMLNRTLEKSVKADVKALKEAGAEFIIAYNHCGVEYSQVPANRQINYAHMFADAGVDYLIGSHPHVLQPFQMLSHGGKKFPVIHSMGNFVSGMKTDETKETIILSLTLKRDKSGKVVLAEQTYYPCYMLDYYQGEHYVLMPEDKEYNDGFTSENLRKSFEHIRKIVGTKHFAFS